MLQSMRKGVLSKVFMAMLVLGGVGLAVMDWQGVYTGGNLGGTDVARIGDDRVTSQDFDRTVRQNLQGANIEPQQAYATGLISHILNQVVTGRMLAQAANDAGITIGETQLAAQLRELLRPITQSGASTKDALDTLVRASGGSQRALFAEIKQREASRLLADPLGGSTAFVPNTLALDMARITQETRRINVLVLPHARITDIKTPNEKDLATYYDTIKKRFEVPEQRSAQLVTLDADALRAQLTVPEAKIEAFYNENKAIFADDQGGTKPLDAVRDQISKQLADDVLAAQLSDTANALDDALAGGATLAEALKDLPAKTEAIPNVTRMTAVKASAVKALPTADQAQVVEALFKLEDGETAPLFPLTDGRYATLRIEKVVPAVIPPLDSVRDQVVADWKTAQRQLANLKAAQAMLDSLKAGQKTLTDLARDSNVYLKTVTLLPGGNAPAPLTAQTRDQVKNIALGDTALISEVDSVLLAQIDAVTYPPKGQVAQQAVDDSTTAARDGFQTQVFDSLMRHVTETANVRVNQRLLERMYGQASAAAQQP